MTLADKVFGGRSPFSGGEYPPERRYLATWAAMGMSVFVAGSGWLLPEEEWEHPSGPWVLTLLGLALFLLSLWGNRYLRRRIREKRTQAQPAPP